MERYGLSYSDVSSYTLVARNTVYSWTAAPESSKRRAMPDSILLLLELQIKQHGLKPV